MSLEKIYFGLLLTAKSRGGKFFEFLHCPFEGRANMHIKSSPIGRLACAVWLVGQKDNIGSQKFFFPCFCLWKQTDMYSFQRHVLPLLFLSLNSQCECVERYARPLLIIESCIFTLPFRPVPVMNFIKSRQFITQTRLKSRYKQTVFRKTEKQSNIRQSRYD